MGTKCPGKAQHYPTKHKPHHTHPHNSAFRVSVLVKLLHAYNALSTSSKHIGPTDFFNLHGAKYTTHTTRPGGMREAIKSPFGSGPFWVPRVAASAQGLNIKPPLQGNHDF